MKFITSENIFVECICGEMLTAYQSGDSSITVKPCPVCTKERELAMHFGWVEKTPEGKSGEERSANG